MAYYCAFLRGVNIGSKTMRMAEVCDVLKAAGLTGVVSIQATGNLIFQADREKGELRNFLEQVLSDHFQDRVNLFVKTSDEIARYLSSLPFEADNDFHIYAFVCEAGFEETLFEEFRKITPSDGESAAISNSLFYWRCRKGATLSSGFSKILGYKHLRDMFTSRTLGTMERIAAKMECM